MSSRTLRQPSGNAQRPIMNFLPGVLKATGSTVLILLDAGQCCSVAGSLVGLAISFRNLPDVRSLKGYIPSETTYIYDINGKVLASFHGEENREVVPLDQVSPEMKLAVLAMEDGNFYQHNGVNPVGIARAVVINISSGGTVQGASTSNDAAGKKSVFISQASLNS